MPSTPQAEINARIAALQEKLGEAGFDGALLVQRVDLFYFSGMGQDAHLYVPVKGMPVLMVRKSIERAVEDSPLQAIFSVERLSDIGKTLQQAAQGDIKKLGMELDVLPVNNFRAYEKLLPEVVIEDVSPIIREIRSVKSPYELALIARAAEMNDALFAMVKEILKPGMTEMEFAGLLEAEYRRMGHQGFVNVRTFNIDVFYGHVMSGSNLAVPSISPGPTGGKGPNASFPHGAGTKKIGKNEPVQVDYVGVHGGYMTDQARTFSIGELPFHFERIHETALAVQAALMKQGVPGARAEDLYETAVTMVEEAGFTEGFMGYPKPVPFVGHGVGLELDELPVLGRKSPSILREGNVIAIEPKFIIPEQGLAGIENTFSVTKDGLRKLTLFSDALQILPEI